MSALVELRVLLAVPLLGAAAVMLAPGGWARRIGGAAAGLALAVAVLAVLAEPAGLAVAAAWIPGLGLEFALGIDGTTATGVLLTCLVGQVAALAPGGSRGTIAGGLALQAALLLTLMARDLGLLVAGHGLLAPLVAGLVAGGRRPGRLRGAFAAGFYLMLATAALAVAAGLLAVAHHDATGGQWRLELASLAQVLLPGRVEAATGALLLVAAAATLGLWPLHGWLAEAGAAARPGPALLVAGPLRWLGVDLLLRLWLPLTPAAAVSVGSVVAGLALAGAGYGALVARAEPDPRRALLLAALVPAGLAVLGAAGQHHEGAVGAQVLGVVLALGGAAGLLALAEDERPWLRRVAGVGLLPAPGLAGCVGAALVVIGTARFAGPTLGDRGPMLALIAGGIVVLAVRALAGRGAGMSEGTGGAGRGAGMSEGTGGAGRGAGMAEGTGGAGRGAEMSGGTGGGGGGTAERTGGSGRVGMAGGTGPSGQVSWAAALRVAGLAAPLVALGVWPGPWLARMDAAGRAVVEAAALRRCLGFELAPKGPRRAPAGLEACAQPVRALERQRGGRP